ncbi:MAG: hypothetical protein RR209_04285 [Angelakisella sp.]
MKEKLAKLVDVKSIVTIAMTAAMIAIMLGGIEVNKEMLMLFSTSYGAVITYFFTRKDEK